MTGLWRAKTASGHIIYQDRKAFEAEDFEELEIICPAHKLLIKPDEVLLDGHALGLFFVIDDERKIPFTITNRNKPVPYTQEVQMFDRTGTLIKRLSPEAGCKVEKGLVLGGRRFSIELEFYTKDDKVFVRIKPNNCKAYLEYKGTRRLTAEEDVWEIKPFCPIFG